MNTDPIQPPLDLLERYGAYVSLRHPLDVLETGDPWRIGCGLILAAHCTDAAVNKAGPGFFKEIPDWKTILGKTRNELIPMLPGISHSGNKADYILNWANYLNIQGGAIDSTVAGLTRVKGIGRKTAAIILFTVKGIDEGIPLDTHALRVLDRLGWFPTTNSPNLKERQLLPWVPRGRRYTTFTILTQHGRHS